MPTVLTSLPKPQALMDTVRKIAAAKLPRKLLVEMSTFAISDKEKAARVLAKAGHVMLDTPVSGTGSQAKNRDLVFYASGDSRLIKRLRPMFEAFGRHVYDVGAFGNGSQMKYVANLLVAINNVATAEAMVLGMKAGLPPQLIYDLITPGAGNSRVFELRAPMMVKGNYNDVTMKIDVWDKDMQVIGDYARKINVPTPMFNATQADLPEGDEERPRRARHRRGLRRAGEDGEGQAQQALKRIVRHARPCMPGDPRHRRASLRNRNDRDTWMPRRQARA